MEWYTERTLSEVSLGGILILVVIRTIQGRPSMKKETLCFHKLLYYSCPLEL